MTLTGLAALVCFIVTAVLAFLTDTEVANLIGLLAVGLALSVVTVGPRYNFGPNR